MHCYSEQSVQKLAILVPEMNMTASYEAHTQAMNARYVPHPRRDRSHFALGTGNILHRRTVGTDVTASALVRLCNICAGTRAHLHRD